MPRVLHTALLVCLVTWAQADVSKRQCDGEHCVCPDGTFGRSCGEKCPPNCRPDSEERTCHSTNGHCTSGCTDGWGGRHCNETCLPNCKRCSMMKASNCVQCSHGYQGPQCIETKSFDNGHHGHSHHSKDRGPSKAFVDTAVGVAFGFFLLLLLVLVLVYTNRHKCRKMLKQKKDDVMFVQDEHGSQQSLDFLKDGETSKNMMI